MYQTNKPIWTPEMILDGPYPPIIVPNIHDPNSVYVVADGKWYVAPANVTVDMVRSQYPKKMVERPQTVRVEYINVASSSGKGSYRVTLKNGKPVDCTCPGFGFRGKCKHTGTY